MGSLRALVANEPDLRVEGDLVLGGFGRPLVVNPPGFDPLGFVADRDGVLL